MKILVALVALVVGLTACATAGPPSSHSRASATPAAGAPGASASPKTRAAAEPLFAVLEAPARGEQADTVAIVGLDGYARAKAKFQPRKGPYVPMAATMPQSEAQVGAAGVYYVDGNGVVRLLKRSGGSTVVATFPMTPDQHELWYAVSPDGGTVLAGILTLPTVVPPPPGTDWPATLAGNWKFELDRASAGGSTRVLLRDESAGPEAMVKPIFPVGWTGSNPVAMVGAPIATQNQWPGGPLFTIDGAGHPSTRIGGGDCTAASVLPSGLVPCVVGPTGSAVSVRDSSGRLVWQPPVDGFMALGLAMAPDGSGITDGRHVATRTTTFVIPPPLVAQGWLDSQTVVLQLDSGHLGYIRVDSPTAVHDLGFKGSFVGALQNS